MKGVEEIENNFSILKSERSFAAGKLRLLLLLFPPPPKRALNSVTLRTSSASVRGVRPRKQGLNFDRFDGVEVRNFFSGAFAPSSLLFSK